MMLVVGDVFVIGISGIRVIELLVSSVEILEAVSGTVV